MYQKEPTYRSEAWRRAVASLRCACCWADGPSQAAHPNHIGKGMGMKSPDCWCVPLCVECHREFDQGTRWPKEDKRDLMDRWIIQTVLELASRGLIKA